MTSLAGGSDGVACALIEAISQAQERNGDVILVIYDDTVPEVYQWSKQLKESTCFAYALKLRSGSDYELSWGDTIQIKADDENNQSHLNTELAFFAWLLSDQSIYTQDRWQWRKHSATVI